MSALPKLVYSPHPLLAAADRQIVYEPFRPGETVADYLARVGVPLAAPAIAQLNGRPLAREEWYRICPREGDLITVRAAVARGGGGSNPVRTLLSIAVLIAAPHFAPTLAGALGIAEATAQALILVGGSLLVNALVPPPRPRPFAAGEGTQDSPTYSLSGGSNRARPYEPLPLVMGRHRVFPDLGAREYTEFVGEDQYLYQVFNFGLSDVALSEFRIGDTPLENFADVEIEESDETGALTLFPANVDTIAGGALTEEAGWIVRTSSPDATRLAVDIEGYLFRAGDNGIEERSVYLEIEYRKVGDSDWQPFLEDGDPNAVPPWQPNTGYIQGDRVRPDPPNDHFYRLENKTFVNPTTGQPIPIVSGETQPNFNTAERSLTSESVSVPPPDPESPGGVYFLNWRESGFYYASPSGVLITSASRKPLRLTYSRSVPRGQYEVRVRRRTPAETSDRVTSDLVWSQLRTYQPDEVADYTGQKRVALRIRASGQLSGRVEAFNAIAAAKCLVWDDAQEDWVLAETSNPAWWFLWFARGKAIGGRRVFGCLLPDERIDIERIKLWAKFCEDRNLTFNAVWDRAGNTAEVLAAIARCGRAAPSWATGKLGVIWDAPNQPPVAVFGMSNIRRGSFQVQYLTADLADEIVVHFVNPELAWQEDTVRQVVPGVAQPTRSADVYLYGCTDKDMAGREANLLAAAQLYRRRLITWETDAEGFVAQRGDVVVLSHDLTQWGYSGRLLAGDGRTVQLDRAVPAAGKEPHWLGVVFPHGYFAILEVYPPGIANQDASRGVLVEGASLHPDFTFTRASPATYFDANGVLRTAAVNEPRFDHDPKTGELLGLLIEEPRTNLLLWSEAFDNAAWVKNGVSVNPADDISVRGITLHKVVGNGNNFTFLWQEFGEVAPDQVVTFSAYMKQGGAARTAIRFWDNQTPTVQSHSQQINWTDGVPSFFGGPAQNQLTRLARTIEPVGDGVYRVTLTIRNDTGGPVTLRAAMYERWDTAPVNRLLWSEALNNAVWVKIGVSVNPADNISVNGITLNKIVGDGTDFRFVRQSLGTVNDGASLTLSAFIKAGDSTQTAIRIEDPNDAVNVRYTVPINWINGVPSLAAPIAVGLTETRAPTLVDLGDGLYRVSISATNATGTDRALSAVYYVRWTGGQGVPEFTYAGGFQGEAGAFPTSYIKTEGSGEFTYWGAAQVEFGSFPTSYIKTEGSTATRAADVCKISDISGFWNSVEGTVLVEFSLNALPSGLAQTIFNFENDATFSRFWLGRNTAKGLQVFGGAAGAGDLNFGLVSSFDPEVGAVNRVAVAIAENNAAGSENGNNVAQDFGCSMPGDVNELEIGSRAGSHILNGHIRRVYYLPKRIANEELQAISATGKVPYLYLGASAPAVDDLFNGFTVRLVATSEERTIVDYDGATRLAKLDAAFDTPPAPATEYEIHDPTPRRLWLAEAWPAEDDKGVPLYVPDEYPRGPAFDYKYVFSPLATPGKRVKLTNVKPIAENLLRLTATDEEPAYYDAEDGEYIYTPPATFGAAVPSLANLRVSDTLERTGNGFAVRVTLAWDASGPYGGAIIRAAPAGEPLEVVGQTDKRSFSFRGPDAGQLHVQVTGFNFLGQKGPEGTVSADYVILGKDRPPAVPQNLSHANGALRWDEVPDVDLDGYMVRYQDPEEDNWETATPAHDEGVVTETEFDTGAIEGELRRFLVRSIDTWGNVSDGWASLVADLRPPSVAGLAFQDERLTWTKVVHRHVIGYVVRHQDPEEDNWETATPAHGEEYITDTEFDTARFFFPGGTRRFLVKAITRARALSATAASVVVDLRPPRPSRFLVSRMPDGTRVFAWETGGQLPRDLAGAVIRWFLGETSDWAAMTPLHEGVLPASPLETNALAAGTYTFAVKNVDRAGNESEQALFIQSVLGDPRIANALADQEQAPDWPGTRTSCHVDPGTGWLIANNRDGWQDVGSWAAMQHWVSNPEPEIRYEVEFDIGVVASFQPLVAVVADGTATVEESHSNDGVSWTSYAALAPNVLARFIRLRVTVTGAFPKIKQMRATLSAQLIEDLIEDLNTATLTGPRRIGVGDVRLPITKSFSFIKSVNVTLQGTGGGWTWELVDKDTTTGPRIRIYNASQQLADAVIDATIKGLPT